MTTRANYEAKPCAWKTVLTFRQPDGEMRVTVFCQDRAEVTAAKRNYKQFAKGELIGAEVFRDKRRSAYDRGNWVAA